MAKDDNCETSVTVQVENFAHGNSEVESVLCPLRTAMKLGFDDPGHPSEIMINEYDEVVFERTGIYKGILQKEDACFYWRQAIKNIEKSSEIESPDRKKLMKDAIKVGKEIDEIVF